MLKWLLIFFAATAWSGDNFLPEAEGGKNFSAKEWMDRWLGMKPQLSNLIPPTVIAELTKVHPEFCPVPLDEHVESAFAEGDFNCDGKVDFAVVGLTKENDLARRFCPTAGAPIKDEPEADALKKRLDEFVATEPGIVWVGLSTKKGRKWIRQKGSQVHYAGADCGCCDRTPKKQRQQFRNKKCGFLYIGCCEKDGRYLNFYRGGVKVQFHEGC